MWLSFRFEKSVLDRRELACDLPRVHGVVPPDCVADRDAEQQRDDRCHLPLPFGRGRGGFKSSSSVAASAGGGCAFTVSAVGALMTCCRFPPSPAVEAGRDAQASAIPSTAGFATKMPSTVGSSDVSVPHDLASTTWTIAHAAMPANRNSRCRYGSA